MIVGYDDPYNNATTNVTLTFKDADGIILYRGGEKNVVELDENGIFDLTLGVGEGVFVVPVYTH